MAAKRQRFTRAAADKDFANPLATVDQIGWLGGDIRDTRVLCLAAGGGKHGPLYAAAGANVDRKSTRLKLQSPMYLVCRLLLEKKNNFNQFMTVMLLAWRSTHRWSIQYNAGGFVA